MLVVVDVVVKLNKNECGGLRGGSVLTTYFAEARQAKQGNKYR